LRNDIGGMSSFSARTVHHGVLPSPNERQQVEIVSVLDHVADDFGIDIQVVVHQHIAQADDFPPDVGRVGSNLALFHQLFEAGIRIEWNRQSQMLDPALGDADAGFDEQLLGALGGALLQSGPSPTLQYFPEFVEFLDALLCVP